jgi:putative ABC transport system permease protein
MLVLIIACINLANLLLADATARQHELAIRGALGAGRGRLVRQLLTESVTLATGGAVLGTALAYATVPALLAAYPGALPGNERISVSILELTFAVAVALATAALFGLAPAVAGVRARLTLGLGTSARAGTSRSTRMLQHGLVAAEAALTLTLVAGAVLLIKSFSTLVSQPLGFSATNVLATKVSLPVPRFPTEGERRIFLENLLNRLEAEPNIAAVTTALPLPFDRSSMGMGFRPDPASGRKGMMAAAVRHVSPSYLDTLGMSLLRGRFFDESDSGAAPAVAVVNDAFARRYGEGRDVLGMRLLTSDGVTVLTVIGVTANARVDFRSLPPAEVMLPLAQTPAMAATIAVRTRSNPILFAPRLREIIKNADGNLPLAEIAPLTAVIGMSVANQRFNMGLLVALASLAIGLAAIGIYGVTAFIVGRRTREIGIRLALGATAFDVRWLVVRQGILPVVIGCVAGLGGAWLLTTLLKKELFKVQPHDPWVLGCAIAVLLCVGFLACWLPARRVARIDAGQVLRSDAA